MFNIFIIIILLFRIGLTRSNTEFVNLIQTLTDLTHFLKPESPINVVAQILSLLSTNPNYS